MGTVIDTPATYTSTCDKCGAQANGSGQPPPTGWGLVPGPGRAGPVPNRLAGGGQATLCPTDLAAYKTFWNIT